MTDEVFSRYAPGKPFPLTNAVWGASTFWDTRPVAWPWQRVSGCCRVVHGTIPEPRPFYGPAWSGWRGVPSANGKVYDFETGREMSVRGARTYRVDRGDLLKKAPKE
jgi:hypothetical protein